MTPPRAILWPTAGLASLMAHGALLAGFALLMQPDAFPPQPMPEARLDIEAHPVDRTTAEPAPVQADPAAAADAESPTVAGANIPVSKATATPATTTPAKALTAPAPTTNAAALPTLAAAPAPAKGDTQPALAPRSDSMAAQPPPAPTLPETAATGPEAPALPPPAETGAPVAAAALATDAASLPPPAERGTASLAWSGAPGPVDPLSLAAIQAFMQPGDLTASDANAGQLRDGIEATLAVPCGRLQTSFDPETGTLDLRGHVPEGALRAPVLAALQAQIGTGIPVNDRMLVLPRPQCQALTGIAAVGLPQSTEQLTNPRVIGADAFVRDYRYTAGQRLVLDLTGPDYPSVIYVDYFDADGNVIHLQPNETVPLASIEPKATLAVGQESPGQPSLDLTVSPPYGQEIAVAFASSVPLYEGLRPLVEPAAPYLAFLQEQVAARRAETHDFKGEWVYFFITTAAE